MDVVMVVIAVAVTGSCLFFLAKSNARDSLEQRKLAKQKIPGQQDKPIEGD
jgi:hypothetical protein